VEKSRTLKFPNDVEGSVTVDAVNTRERTLSIKGNILLDVGQPPPRIKKKNSANLAPAWSSKRANRTAVYFYQSRGESAAIVSWDFRKAENDDPHVLVSVLGLKTKRPKGAGRKKLEVHVRSFNLPRADQTRRNRRALVRPNLVYLHKRSRSRCQLARISRGFSGSQCHAHATMLAGGRLAEMRTSVFFKASALSTPEYCTARASFFARITAEAAGPR